MNEILLKLQDFRQRVLHADRLRREGKDDEAASLMPSRDELIEAVKAYRLSIGQKTSTRAASSQKKAKAAEVLTLDPKNLLD